MSGLERRWLLSGKREVDEETSPPGWCNARRQYKTEGKKIGTKNQPCTSSFWRRRSEAQTQNRDSNIVGDRKMRVAACLEVKKRRIGEDENEAGTGRRNCFACED